MMNYIFFTSSLLLLSITFILLKRYFSKNIALIYKGFSILLACLLSLRVLSSSYSAFTYTINLSINNPFDSPLICLLTVITIWFLTSSTLINIFIPFFRFRIIKNLSKTFSLISNVLGVIFLNQISFSYTNSNSISLFSVAFSIELALSFLLSIDTLLTDGFIVSIRHGLIRKLKSGFNHRFLNISKKEGIEILFTIPFILLFSIPDFMPQTIFPAFGAGFTNDFKIYHRIFLYIVFIVIFGLYFLFRNKDKEYIRMALLFINLTALISFCKHYSFEDFLKPWQLPLHLCHTAMFITPIVLMFKLNKAFYFTMFINVLGAFLALLMPNYNGELNVLNPTVISFYLNHIMAFSQPIVIAMLKIYPHPKLKEFLESNIFFTGYFIFALICNVIMTNYAPKVDFFFINSDYIAHKLGKWAEDLRTNFTWTITISPTFKLVFYPLYQLIFYLVYIAFGGVVWFIYLFLFQFQDYYDDLREKKKEIKIDEKGMFDTTIKKEILCKRDSTCLDKLKVTSLSKHYEGSDCYAIKDISFVANVGDIIGFLGPNGVGKSTTLKCIVGINTIDYGRVNVNGFDISLQPSLSKKEIGYVPDNYSLYENLTGREYLNYMADLFNVSQADRDKRIDDISKRLNIDDFLDDSISTYSHGMKQKIALIASIIHHPKLWILDEPLTGLDPESIYQTKKLMIDYASNGGIVLFSTHIIDLAETICNRIIIINHGSIVKSEEIKKKNINKLERFYLDIVNDTKDVKRIPYIKKEEPSILIDSKFFNKKDKKKVKNV